MCIIRSDKCSAESVVTTTDKQVHWITKRRDDGGQAGQTYVCTGSQTITMSLDRRTSFFELISSDSGLLLGRKCATSSEAAPISFFERSPIIKLPALLHNHNPVLLTD
jgi:hypothetical protein